jgi:hypothetical protein
LGATLVRHQFHNIHILLQFGVGGRVVLGFDWFRVGVARSNLRYFHSKLLAHLGAFNEHDNSPNTAYSIPVPGGLFDLKFHFVSFFEAMPGCQFTPALDEVVLLLFHAFVG